MRSHLLTLPLVLLLVQCHKNNPTPAKPEDQLPAATQIGAGTFGCLINGQPWIPSDTLNIPNFFVVYDASFHAGNLDVRTYRSSGSSNSRQYFSFGGDGVSKAGTYTINTASPNSQTVYFSDDSKRAPCNFYNLLPGTSTTKGHFTLTRLDQQQGIVSGTFEFILAQPGCDTIKVTQGRFDYKL